MRKFFKLCGVALLGVTMLSSCTDDYVGDSRNVAENSINQSDLNGTWEAVSVEGVIDLYVYDLAKKMQDYNINQSFLGGWSNEVEKTIYNDYYVRLKFEDRVLHGNGHDYNAKLSTMQYNINGKWRNEDSEVFSFVTPNKIKILYTTYEIRELTHDRLVLYLTNDMAKYSQDLTKDYHYMILTYKRVE